MRHRESSRSTKEIDAKNLLDQRIADVKAGRLVGSRVERTSLEELLAILVDDYRVNVRRSLDRLQFAIPNLCAYFGADGRAMDITPDRITAYQVHRQQEGMAASTINYELAMLRRAFKLAARAGKVGVRPEFSMLHTDNARKGFFEAREYAAVKIYCPTI